MPVTLPELPFANDALEPLMSSRTLDYHHGKHHAGYVKKLNGLIEGTQYASMELRDIVLKSGETMDSAVFNNAAQTLNHTMFWDSLSPGGGASPTGALAAAIERQFGSFDDFKKEFRFSATTLFGSGWVWLVCDGTELRIVTTGNAGTPITEGLEPLLTLDVWEHAYYLDVQNDRASYVDAFLDKLVNWAGAGERYDRLCQAS